MSLMNIDPSILNKILANWIYQHTKQFMFHNKVESIPGIQGCFNIWKSINVRLFYQKIKNKTIWFSQ